MTRLEERRDHLAALPSTPARIDYRPTGRTFADRWQEEDEARRRQLMVNAGFQIRIARTRSLPKTSRPKSAAWGSLEPQVNYGEGQATSGSWPPTRPSLNDWRCSVPN